MRWYNWSAPTWRRFRLWNLFNRRCENGEHYWGVGVLQFRNRHLAYVGHSGASLLFLGRTP